MGSPEGFPARARKAGFSAELRNDENGELRPLVKDKTLWAWTLGTFFGAGYLKPGPGTYGSAAACVLWLLAGWFVHHNTEVLIWVTGFGVILATTLGIPAATRVAREAGRPDPGFVVIDEVAGQWVALLFMPPLWPNALLAFVLFRFFDILKPWPIRQLEALPEGTGIMVDDLGAGLVALGVGQVVLRLMQHVH